MIKNFYGYNSSRVQTVNKLEGFNALCSETVCNLDQDVLGKFIVYPFRIMQNGRASQERKPQKQLLHYINALQPSKVASSSKYADFPSRVFALNAKTPIKKCVVPMLAFMNVGEKDQLHKAI